MASYERDETPVMFPLQEADHLLVYSLMARCEDYFYLQDGEAPEQDDARQFFSDVPETKVPNDQLVFGYGQRNLLTGLIAVLKDYPENKTWYIGLALVDPALRSSGVGRILYRYVQDLAIESGAECMKAAVIEKNGAALQFWRKLGFIDIRLCSSERFKRLRHSRIELALSLAGRN